MGVGAHFGEIAPLTGSKRTATIQSRNYTSLGVLDKKDFEGLCNIYPEFKTNLMESLNLYQDHFKVWKTQLLRNITFLQGLKAETLEYLNYQFVI